MENILENDLLNQILKPGLTREQMEQEVYSLFPVLCVTGKIGGWIIRWRNGKPIISRQASSYNSSQTEKSIANRNSLAAATYFASPLNKVEMLKEIWNQARVEGNCAFRKIIKYNKKYFVDNHPSINNKITPGEHQLDMDAAISFNFAKTLKINCNSRKLNDTLIIALVPFDPIKSGIKEFEVITLSLSLTDDVEINLSEKQLNICKKYKKYILYSAIVRKNASEITWSNTVVTEGELYVEVRGGLLFFLLPFYTPYSVVEIRGKKLEIIKKAHPPPGILCPLWKTS